MSRFESSTRLRSPLPAIVLAATALVACRSTPATRSFGAGVPAADPIAVERVLAQPESFDGRTLLIEGRVASVCPIKGCWMLMNDGKTEMRVTFKDYAFFVPMDCGGATVRAHGTFAIETVSVADARHYLEDAGEHDRAAAIVEPVESLTFVATGVEILGR